VWDLAKVAAMIDADAHIEAAFKLQSLVTEVVAENERRARVKELEEWQEWATNELNHLEALTKENAHLKALLEAAQSVSPVANGESIETLPGDPFGRPPEPTPEPKLDPSV
jgi:cell shape-determining protein MreC